METTRPTQVTTGGQMPYSFGLDVSFELHEQQKCRRFMRNCSKSAARIGATSRRRWREDNPPSLAPSSPVSSRVSSPSSPARAYGDGGLFALCSVSAPAAAAVALCPGCHASVIHASSSRGNLSCASALIHHHTASDMANETVVARIGGDGAKPRCGCSSVWSVCAPLTRSRSERTKAAAAPLLSSVIYFGAEGKSEKRKGRQKARMEESAKTKGNLSACARAVLLSLSQSLSSIERQRRERV